MNQDELKTLVGRAALEFVVDGAIVGVGTGSTVNKFIDALATVKHRVAGAVSSSNASTERLRAAGIRVFEANEVESLPVYIDGADEIDRRGNMIKGAGAALTREKIVADLAGRFVCIVDASKQVDVLGKFALPVEVIEMARERIVRRFAALGGRALPRAGVITDNGHPILDVHGLSIADPLAMESEINQWPGVVACGIFARHRARVALIGTADGVRRIDYA
jgi:ribose 5-phosphate isomerase A